MADKIDFEKLGKKLKIKIPEEIRLFNFLDLGATVDLIDRNSGFVINNYKFKSKELVLTIDKFIKPKNFESYWKGRMGGDLWEYGKRFLGIASCVAPYGFILFSLNKENYGTIWFEYSYRNEGEDLKRKLLEKNLILFLEKLEPVV